MKQGKHYTTIILWIVLAAIVGYFAYSIVSSVYEPLSTSTVIEYEAGAGYYTTGYVARSETVISSSYDITVLTRAEAERVSAGASVATGYLTSDAQSRQSRIKTLQAQLEQLRYAYQYSASAADQAALDGEILSDLTAYAKYLARRDMNSVDDMSAELKGLLLRRGADDTDAASIQSQMDAVQLELDELQSQSASDTKQVTVSASGYFSGSVDGYEAVLMPERLQTMSVQDFNALVPEAVSEKSAGKLILGDTWYYVTTVPAAEVSDVQEGDDVGVSFARDFYSEITMTVERIGDNEAGFRLLVLSCDKYMQNVTLLRQQSADVVFASYSGLRVPKDAVRVENGQAGVYILEGANAKWKPITILHDNGESYVVQLDKTSTGNLWPGDEVIVNAKNLYDGKVVG